MTEILFIIACALLAAAVVDRWRRRAVLVVSTAEGTYRGRRAATLRFGLIDVEVLTTGAEVPLPGTIAIPRRQITLIQILPVEARAPEPAA